MKRIDHSIGWIAMAMCLMSPVLLAQDKAEKEIITLSLSFYQLNENLPVIKVSAKTKKDRKFLPVEGVGVNLFFNAETAQGFMARVETNSHGAGSLPLPERFKARWDSLASVKFVGTVTQNERFDDQSTELEISKAKIELTLSEVDSAHSIRARVLAYQGTGWVAQPEIEVKLVVRRLASDLPATAEETFTTDDKGEVSANFGLIIPGDAQGTITIGAKLEEHELFGSLVTTQSARWGVPQAPDTSFAKRTLWATRDKTPIWLLVFPNLIIVGVWGIIFYLIFLVAQIIKLGKSNSPS